MEKLVCHLIKHYTLIQNINTILMKVMLIYLVSVEESSSSSSFQLQMDRLAVVLLLALLCLADGKRHHTKLKPKQQSKLTGMSVLSQPYRTLKLSQVFHF